MAGRFSPFQKPDKTSPVVWRWWRYAYLRFIRLQDDPATLARGFALGVFVGITPTIPFHTILTLGLALIFRGSKMIALLASVLVSNPLTFCLQYYLAWKIGSWISPTDLSWERMNAKLDIIRCGAGFTETLSILGKMSMDTLAGLILGGIVLALPIAAASYVISLYCFRILRTNYREKHVLR